MLLPWHAVFQCGVSGACDQQMDVTEHSGVTTDSIGAKSNNGQALLTQEVWFRILKSQRIVIACPGFWFDPF